MRGTVRERFEAKFKRGEPNECWEWIAGLTGKGYGAFYKDGHTVDAHKVAWILANGRDPKQHHVIMHTCDNPSCVNPAHLKEGTYQQNSQDMSDKGRHAEQAVTHCPHGHEYTTDNTYVHTGGSRGCLECRRSRARQRSRNTQ